MRGKKLDIRVTFEDGKSASRDTECGDMDVAREGWACTDAKSMFKGLPDGRCQCPCWGYLVQGRVRIEYLDREEVINAGEVYYLPPGHTPVAEEDSEMVEFSPKSEYRKTMEVAIRNMKALNKAG
jgi:hypothetical protein